MREEDYNMKNRVLSPTLQAIYFTLLVSFFQGCTTVVVDQTRQAESQIKQGESIVVIGRRSASDYETEQDLISCVGDILAKDKQINVVPEDDFVDSLYPYFEPRIAPTRVQELNKLLSFNQVEQAIDDYNIHYVIWIDGSTETTSSSGQINCGITGAGVSCFGFGTWDKKADYEASIWDYREKKLIGKVSSSADGTSYMPAVVVPIPIIAPVQGDACKAMGSQLRSFFSVNQVPNDF